MGFDDLSQDARCGVSRVLGYCILLSYLVCHVRCVARAGEDVVSWLQSECGSMCSVEEALLWGNRMVKAGLIYHATYGHGLQNSRLYYK